MLTRTIIGFDSAWVDKAPGAICAVTFEGSNIRFEPPISVRFADAVGYIEDVKAKSDFTLIALDQPTVVPNAGGCRPVERVAASVVSAIGGGVQPANRSKATMFGDDAPVWRFLDQLNARENPAAARAAERGMFLIEVFPALSLPSMIPEIWHRRRAAKYNPQNRKKFRMDDWKLITGGIAKYANSIGLRSVGATLRNLRELHRPDKCDQDKVDAVISMLIGITWRYGAADSSLVLGDGREGYMVTSVTRPIREVLISAGAAKSVPINGCWSGDAVRTVKLSPTKQTAALGKSNSGPQPGSFSTTPKRNAPGSKVCPECGHAFKGSGCGGIDAHWKAKHEDIMPYDQAFEIIKVGNTPSLLRKNNQRALTKKH